MIEQLLLLAFGFLLAALGAIAMLPALWRRAVRLTRARLEATLPLSPDEIAAEKDQIRAVHAVAMRQYELKLEAADTATQKARAETGDKTLIIHHQQEDLARKDQQIATLETDKSAALSTLAATGTALSETRKALEAEQNAMRELTARSEALQLEIDAQSRKLAEANRHIQQLEQNGVALQEALSKAHDAATDAGNALRQSQDDVLKAREDNRRLERLNRDLVGQTEMLEQHLVTARALAAQQAERIETVAAEHMSALNEAGEWKRTADGLKRDKSTLEGNLARVQRRIADLEAALEKRRETGKSFSPASPAPTPLVLQSDAMADADNTDAAPMTKRRPKKSAN